MCKRVCGHSECNNKLTEKQKKYCSIKCARSVKRPWRKTGKYVKCYGCGKAFYARNHKIENNNKIFCSFKCQKIEIETICKSCGIVFKHKPYHDRSFCSRDCSNKAGDYRKNGIEKKCENCDDIFYAPQSESDKRFCSIDCHDDYRREIRVCDNCNNEFHVRKSDPQTHCSRDCWKENAKTYPHTSFLRNKIRLRQGIKKADDRYIKGLISQSSGLSAKDIPKELVELKRLGIKRKRKLNEITHGNSQ